LTKTEIHMTGSDRVRMRNRFPRFFSYHISTNVSLRMTDMATGRVPLEGWGARMCNRKLRDILSNVTRRASPGKYGSAHARPEVPLWCDLICSQTQPKRIGMCYITNQSLEIEPIQKMNHSRFPWKGGVRACSTGSCAIFALVGPFHRK
jgi:hypothetical protein